MSASLIQVILDVVLHNVANAWLKTAIRADKGCASATNNVNFITGAQCTRRAKVFWCCRLNILSFPGLRCMDVHAALAHAAC